MTEAATKFTSENLLHPRQVTELNETKTRLQAVLGAAPHIRNQLQDGGAFVTKQITEIDRMLDQAPRKIPRKDIDDAVALEQRLRDDWLKGMPTQAEMRKNPPGAVDKNIAWLNSTKAAQLRWKHLRRRLHASGISDHKLADEGDISNIEMFRPKGGSGEMSMENAQIPGKGYFLPNTVTAAAVMSDVEETFLKDNAPEILDQMAILDNEMRHKVLDKVREIMAERIVDSLVGSEPPKRKPGRPPKANRAPDQHA